MPRRRSLVPDPAPTELPKTTHRPRKRRRRKRQRFAVPAWLVFYAMAGLGVAGAGLVYLRGGLFLPLSIAACVLILASLLINERSGFTRSKRLRRSGERRVNYEDWEVAALFVLLLVNVFVSVQEWAG